MYGVIIYSIKNSFRIGDFMKKRIDYVLITLLVIIFVFILFCVVTGNTETFDTTIYELVTICKTETTTNIFKFITFFGSTFFIIFLCILFLLIFWKNKKGLLISICLIISTILNNVIKVIVRRERPLSLMLVEENTFSFPSGHTMAAVSMYGLLVYFIYKSNLDKKIKILLISFLALLTMGIAISRIYLGAHYASDVLAGMILSLALLICFVKLVEKV